MDIRTRLATLLPESAQPYAKAIFALIIFVVGLLVSLLVIDDETGLRIVQAVTALAALLGIYEIPNIHPPVEAQPVEPATLGKTPKAR
jgi:uncharacterized protein YqhQ